MDEALPRVPTGPEHSGPYETETLLTPERIAQELVARVERGLAELHVPPRDARGWGWCNFVPDALSYCALQDGEENGYRVKPQIFQLADVHSKAAGLSPSDDGSGQVKRSAFRHAFNVLTIEDQPFLMDLTFAQFLGGNGYIGNLPTDEWTSEPNDNLLAQQLITHGYVPLTDETLREYLRITTLNPDPDYLGNVNIGLLADIEPLFFERDDNELMGRIPPAYGPTPRTE